MNKPERTKVKVTATINAPVGKVWNFWTNPSHIVNWNNASEDWHTPYAENDLRKGGKFLSRMAAKDGSMSFDFSGTYSNVTENELLEYDLVDGRTVSVTFEADNDSTTVTEVFDAEDVHSVDIQRAGWQAILDNFKRYTEASTSMEKLEFEIEIKASTEAVYSAMLDEEKYREWTSVFNPTSRYEGSWDKGAKIRFIGVDSKGNTAGMIARIRENIPNKFISIEHIGILNNGEEILSGPEVDGWQGALENYEFISNGNMTNLKVSMDANENFKEYFEETWPKALLKLKQICES